MECNELYKDWIRYLKKNKLYSYYIYTIGKSTTVNFCKVYEVNKPAPHHIFFVPPELYENDLFLIDKKALTIPKLIYHMKTLDARVLSLNCIYHGRGYIEKPFEKEINWKKTAREFIFERFETIYGKEITQKSIKIVQKRKKKREEAEAIKRKKESAFWFDCSFTEPEIATAAITFQDAIAQNTRDRREEVGQWYDRFNRDNFRRENRWRLRR